MLRAYTIWFKWVPEVCVYYFLLQPIPTSWSPTSPPHTAPRICFIFFAGRESHTSALMIHCQRCIVETKGCYLQDLAQSESNNISLPLMINGSTPKEDEDRLFKREHVGFVLWLSTVNSCFETWVWWDECRLRRHFAIVTNKQINKPKSVPTALCYMCLWDMFTVTLGNELLFSRFTWISFVKSYYFTFETCHQARTIQTPIAQWGEIQV